MDNTNRIAKSLESIDRTMKLIAQELRRSNDLKAENVIKAMDRKDINRSSF